MSNWRMEQPGTFGTELVFLSSGPIGATNYLGGASPLTANTTTTFRLGGFGRRVRFAYVSYSATTVPADADGTILATAFKYSATADAQVALTAAQSLEALVTREGTQLAALSTQTEAQLTLEVGDTIEVAVINNSAAIDTQPGFLNIVVCAYALD